MRAGTVDGVDVRGVKVNAAEAVRAKSRTREEPYVRRAVRAKTGIGLRQEGVSA
ncbi:hypothetical protein ABCR94_19390 [Streptomyces sp. 21So2-11]|uniref:hypothetical protein n=1 Tax=Streptomyces sp. 21So2-11 TaxID=3144408 RepID=UPI00321A7240